MMKLLDQNKLQHNLEDILQRTVAERRILGGICQVNQNGVPVAQVSCGQARFGSDAKPTEQDVFRLASMSKNICGIAALRMMEEKNITMETKAAEFFQGFADKWIGKPDESGKLVPDRKSEVPITVYHLLTHTNGLCLGLMPGEVPDEAYDTIAHYVDFCANEALLSFEPGSMWFYSALAGCDVLARMVEILYDMPYNEFVRKNITEPLEMPDTTFTPNEDQWRRMVTVLDRDADGNEIDDPQSVGRTLFLTPLTHFASGGGMVSTLSDYMKLSDTLRRGGTSANGYRLLSEASVKTMGSYLTPQGMQGMFFPNMVFGALVRVTKDNAWMPDGCYGWGGAYGTHTWVDPQNQISVVYMKNSRVQDSVLASTGDFAFEKAVYDSFVD